MKIKPLGAVETHRDHNRRVSGSKPEVATASFFCTSFALLLHFPPLYFRYGKIPGSTPFFLLFFGFYLESVKKEMVDIRQEIGIQSRDYLSFKSHLLGDFPISYFPFQQYRHALNLAQPPETPSQETPSPYKQKHIHSHQIQPSGSRDSYSYSPPHCP
jgi:hypothetical protein